MPRAVDHEQAAWAFCRFELRDVARVFGRIQERGAVERAERGRVAAQATEMIDQDLDAAQPELGQAGGAEGVRALARVLQDDDGRAVVDRRDAGAEAG
jgi:hypothetical protein